MSEAVMERVPPYSEEAEKGAIGCLLLDALKLMPVAQARYRLSPESFYIPAHRTIVEVLFRMEAEQRPIDVLTVSDRLQAGGVMDRIGGPTVLDRIVDATPTSAHGEYFFDQVRVKAELRAVMEACMAGWMEARTDTTAAVVLSRVQETFAQIVSGPVESKSNAYVMAGILEGWRDASDGKPPAIGILTPWESVTRTLCGLDEGVIIVAGRPSAGKTTLEDQIALFAAESKIPVGRVTLDSTRRQLLGRSICRMAGVSMPRMKFGFGRKDQHAAALVASVDISELPIYFNDRDTDIAQICAWARYQKRKNDIGLLTLDYIQLVGASCMGRQEWDAVARVTYVSKTLKALSYELGIPVLVLSQLSRLMEQENREPKLSDLRDSGAIEQDANKVVFVYVDNKKRKEMEGASRGATKHKRPVWVNVMKHKDGETGAVPMWLYPPYFRFEECEKGGLPFADDGLPGESHEDQRDFAARPEYFPDEEGERRKAEGCRLKAVGKTGTQPEQFALPVGEEEEG